MEEKTRLIRVIKLVGRLLMSLMLLTLLEGREWERRRRERDGGKLGVEGKRDRQAGKENGEQKQR